MSRKRYNKKVDGILRKIGLQGHPRDASIMEQLAGAVVHPAQIANSTQLSDDDTLKISARAVLEDFEAVTNGMKRPDSDDESTVDDQSDPMYSWRILINAIAAFYQNDITAMKILVCSIPENSPAALLRNVFEILAGKLTNPDAADRFADSLLVRRKELSDGLDILEEAALYPEQLRNEISRYLPTLAQESSEGSKRLYYWAMEHLAEDEPLTELDELSASVPGAGEASRICALASIRYDPDRALLAWMRSLHSVIAEGSTTPLEATARLMIAGELMEAAKRNEMLTGEIISGVTASLKSSYTMMETLLPALPPVPTDPEDLYNWLIQAGKAGLPVNKPLKQRKRKVKTRELFLFDEVSS